MASDFNPTPHERAWSIIASLPLPDDKALKAALASSIEHHIADAEIKERARWKPRKK